MLPKSYCKYIINYPAIQTFTPAQKTSAVKLVWFLQRDGQNSFSKNTLQNWFGRNYHYMVRLICNSDEQYSQDYGICKTYWLKQEVKDYLNTFNKIQTLKTQSFAERDTEEIVDENGKTLHVPPKNAVIREDINGKRKQSSVNISTVLYIDYEKLQKAIEIIDVVIKSQDMSTYNIAFNPKKNRDFQTLKLTLNHLETILLISKNSFSDMPNIPVQYQELGCGRLQGVWLNPQGMVSEIRNYILSDGGKGDGVYDYDMSNCHFTIAYQMYQQMVAQKIKSMNYRASKGLPHKKVEYKELPALKNYLENKDEVRKAIAVETGMWISEVKVLIISILYGKRFASKKVLDKTELENFFGMQYDIIPEQRSGSVLQQSPTLRALKQDIDIMVDLLTKDKSATGKAIINAMGKVKDGTRLNKFKKLNHIIMGIESYIIQEVANRYKDNVLLLMYDGFIANVEIFELINFPQHFVIGEWGFSVQFEMKKL